MSGKSSPTKRDFMQADAALLEDPIQAGQLMAVGILREIRRRPSSCARSRTLSETRPVMIATCTDVCAQDGDAKAVLNVVALELEPLAVRRRQGRCRRRSSRRRRRRRRA